MPGIEKNWRATVMQMDGRRVDVVALRPVDHTETPDHAETPDPDTADAGEPTDG